MLELNKIYQGDNLESLKALPDSCVDMCVTSPPYYALRDYGCDGQIGLEDTPEQYIQRLVDVFHEVKRVLKDDGTLWVNIGDSYSGNCSRASNNGRAGYGNPRETVDNRVPEGCKPKDLIGIPWMLAFALRADGWYLRQDIIWHKPNPMPESVKDRCTKSHEYIFLLSKSPKYYFNYEEIQEEAVVQDSSTPRKFGGNKYGDNDDPHYQTYSGNVYKPRTKNCMEKGQTPNTMHLRREEGFADKDYVVRNKRDVWSVCTKPCKEAHFAVFPEQLIVPCIKAGCAENGVVLDPFMGSGTTAIVARKLARNYIGCELNPEYIKIAEERMLSEVGLFM